MARQSLLSRISELVIVVLDFASGRWVFALARSREGLTIVRGGASFAGVCRVSRELCEHNRDRKGASPRMQ